MRGNREIELEGFYTKNVKFVSVTDCAAGNAPLVPKFI